jgi:hypothetical protein
MTRVEAWLEAAADDADRRGLSALRPLLEGLARSTTALRGAGWNDRALSRTQQPSDVADRESGGEDA